MRTFYGTASTLVTVLVVTSCTPSTVDSPASPGLPAGVDASLPSEASTPASTSGEVDLALDTYRGMWRAYAEAGATSDWRSPDLSRFAVGDALSSLTQGLHTAYEQGVVSRGEPILTPVAATAEPAGAPTTVMVRDCGDSSNWTRHRADNGERAADDPTGRRRIEALVSRQSDGSWKVSRFVVREIGSC